jgi:hypothetical protein
MGAAEKGQVEVVRLLLTHPDVGVNIKDNKVRCSLLWEISSALSFLFELWSIPHISPCTFFPFFLLDIYGMAWRCLR